MLCGNTIVQDSPESGQIYRIVANLEDTNKESEQKELDSLPSKTNSERTNDIEQISID